MKFRFNQCLLITAVLILIAGYAPGRTNTEQIKSLSWNPKGDQLLSGGFDGALRVTNAITGERRIIYHTHSPFIIGVKWSPDGTRLLATTDKTVELIDTEGNEIRTITAKPQSTTVPYPEYGSDHITGQFSPDGKKLTITGWKDGRVEILESQTGDIERVFERNNSNISSISWSLDGKLLAAGAWDKTVRLWDFESGREIAAFKVEINGWVDVKFSPDAKILVWRSLSQADIIGINTDNKSDIWLRKLEKGSEWRLEREDITRSIAWDPKGKLLAILGGKSLDIWNLEKEEMEISFDLKSKEVSWHPLIKVDQILWSPNGRYILAFSSAFQDISIWNVQSGKRKHMSGFPFAFSPDMKYIAIGNEVHPFQDF